MNKEDFEKEISKITNNEDSGTFFEIEKAYNDLSGNKVKPVDGIKILYDTIPNIIKKDEKNAQMRITAYAKILNAEAVILFHELEMNFTYLISHVKEPLKSQTYLEWLELEDAYLKRLDVLLHFAMENRYFLAVSNLASSKARWNYKRIFHAHLLNNWKKNRFDLMKPLNADDLETLTKDCEKLDKIAGTYEMLEHRENMISCLNNKYEILHFLGLNEEVDLIKTKILEIIEENDFVGLKAQYNEMINGKTPHEKFIKDYTERINGIQKLVKKIGMPFYKESEELFLKRKPEWSIDTFFEFKFP